MKFCIISNKKNDFNKTKINKVKKVLKKLNLEYFELPLCDSKKYYYSDPKDVETNTDIILVLGGDGTILNVASDFLKLDIPILAINCGSVGFLTQLELEDIDSVLKQIKNKEYSIEKRTMIDGIFKDKNKKYKKYSALNEIVIKNSKNDSYIILELIINNEFVCKYTVDGLIISTPTGSTAYNMSVGGPIINPDSPSLVITPIASCGIQNRSIVVNDNDEIKIKICKGKYNTVLKSDIIYDGKTKYQLMSEDVIKIVKSNYYASFLKINNNSFINALLKKFKKF